MIGDWSVEVAGKELHPSMACEMPDEDPTSPRRSRGGRGNPQYVGVRQTTGESRLDAVAFALRLVWQESRGDL